MAHVTVSHSPNATGVVIYDSNGTNTFMFCNFTNNTFFFKDSNTLIDDETYPGGGGFYVEFTYCGPGLTCESPVTERNSGAEFVFLSCKFLQNEADNLNTNDRSTYIVPHGSDHEAFGRGGGLSLFLKGKAHNNVFKIQKCAFENNIALWGGGMFVELHDDVYGNNISVMGSVFINNSCPYTIYGGTAGGGMRIGLYVYNIGGQLLHNTTKNYIIVDSSYFNKNSALYGGGLSISPSLQNTAIENVAGIHLLANIFENNVAKIGSAISIDRFGDILVGLMVNVWVEACTFKENTNAYAKYIGKEGEPYQLGLGVLHINEVPVWFRGNVTLEDNDGSAVAVAGSVISFCDCDAQFRRNHGNKGAGIALYGTSSMKINDGSFMLFEGNIAISQGGAIYNSYINWQNLKSDSN